MSDEPHSACPAGLSKASPAALMSQAESNALAAALVGSAADAIVGMDPEGRVTVWNAGAESLFGWSAEEMLGRSVDALSPPERRSELARVLRTLAGAAETTSWETERLHRSGTLLPVSCRLSPILDEEGRVVGACCLIREISREVELRQQLEAARRAAEARFDQSVVAQATLSQDGVLIEVNEALCRLSGYPRKELLGRAATEFTFQPGGGAACDPAWVPAEQAAELRHPHLLRSADGSLIETLVSLSPVRDRDGGVERLEAVIEDVSAAAAAQRQVRLNGARWRSLASRSSDVDMRSESSAAAVCRARLIEDLRRGLDNDELVVHFQPIISLPDGRSVAAEALVRWQHPVKGLLSPAAFIVAAEDSGLIFDVGEVVLREACHAAARWAQVGGGLGTFYVSVNLSAMQLTRGGIVDVVRQALSDSGAAPDNLMLEVTESAVMSDVEAAVRTLQELRALGVAIAVDDFGTGYSSLTYLKQFPVTVLKIDRSFVSGLGANSDDAAIVTSVINLALSMGLGCIAEGLETEQQRRVLQALGCTLGQGFLWSPALDAAAFETWLGCNVIDTRSRQGAPAAIAAVVKRAVDLSVTGASFATIAAALNADKQLTPGGKRWTSRTVAQLLTAHPPR